MWPHNHLDPHFVNHMPKFQDISWDQLVAGEVAIILQANMQALGCLQLLKQLTYWKLRSGNLHKIQQLYMAVVHTIEEGESSCVVMGDQSKASQKLAKPLFDPNSDHKDVKKILFCKKYQVDDCHVELKNNAHWGTLGGKSRLLHHVCTACLLKCKKAEHHREKTGYLFPCIGT